MILYSVAAATKPKIGKEELALIESLLQTAGVNKSSPNFKSFQDALASSNMYDASNDFEVVMAISSAFTFLVSLLYFCKVQRQDDASNSVVQ